MTIQRTIVVLSIAVGAIVIAGWLWLKVGSEGFSTRAEPSGVRALCSDHTSHTGRTRIFPARFGVVMARIVLIASIGLNFEHCQTRSRNHPIEFDSRYLVQLLLLVS